MCNYIRLRLYLVVHCLKAYLSKNELNSPAHNETGGQTMSKGCALNSAERSNWTPSVPDGRISRTSIQT